MNSYFEVAWLMMTGIALSSHGLAFALIPRPFFFKKILVISALSSAAAVWGYRQISLVFLAEIIPALWLYRVHWKAMLQMELCRLFLLTFGKYWTQGLLVQGVLFVPQGTWSWLSYLFVLLLLFLIFRKWVAPRFFQETFQMPVQIRIHGNQITLRGYLDSGNLLRHRNCPVLFLAGKYSFLTEGMTGTEVHFRTVCNQNQCLVYPCEIQIDKTWQHAYAAFSSQLNQPIDCLLNSRLFC